MRNGDISVNPQLMIPTVHKTDGPLNQYPLGLAGCRCRTWAVAVAARLQQQNLMVQLSGGTCNLGIVVVGGGNHPGILGRMVTNPKRSNHPVDSHLIMTFQEVEMSKNLKVIVLCYKRWSAIILF